MKTLKRYLLIALAVLVGLVCQSSVCTEAMLDDEEAE